MRKFSKKLSAFLLLMLCCALLFGCTKPVKFAGGKLGADETDISMVIQPGETALLDQFEALQSADLSGSECIDEIYDWAKAHPEVSVTYTVTLPGGQTVDNRCAALDLSALSADEIHEAAALFRHLPLESLELGEGRLSPEDLGAVLEASGGAKLSYGFSVGGKSFTLDEVSVDLSVMKRQDMLSFIGYLPYMDAVRSIRLGDETNGIFTWEDIGYIHASRPEAALDYSFTLYGKEFTLADTVMNLNHIDIEDEGALVKQITVCMSNLTYLDMDSCGVSSEAMAEIRDALPNTEVVWRIWFGRNYSVRTNVETILASNPGLGGELTPENCADLKYCTRVKHLDLGHNSYLKDLSFLSYMPELEVVVLAMADWTDISPLADCPKIEYAEIQTSALNDLRPLAGCENLRHLNICYCFALHDITPIMELDLDRLWIGSLTPIPPEQVEEFRRLHPDCEVNDTTIDPTAEGWRYLGHDEFGVSILAERYELLRSQFRYGEGAYSYWWLDPLYYSQPE